MKNNKWLLMTALLLASNVCWAYGGGGSSSSKACDKPKFTDFIPAENAEVAPGANFSFKASKNTYPNTIKVVVKDTPITLKTEATSSGTFDVSGQLPASLKNTYARIAITADAQSNCKGSGGWLLKVKE